ncbi:MAG: UDP binding domain-containing protein, partial [Rugosibacter sp.]|nr:UDP binding domain-containing protein [Rugosibacter sp.]
LMIEAGSGIKGAKVNVLGLTFKENCPDLRNSKVPDIITELQSYGIEVTVHDPLADTAEAMHEYGLTLTAWENLPAADAVVIAVAHDAYRQHGATEITEQLSAAGCVIDVKSLFGRDAFGMRKVWTL